MTTLVRPLRETELGTLRALVQHASLASQFDKFQGEYGIEHKLGDPKLARDGLQVAFVDGEPAGFALAWLLGTPPQRWAMTRVGVIEPMRRRGAGRALAEALLEWLRAQRPAVAEVAASAWLPSDAGGALAARLGFAHERYFWLMERPRGTPPGPAVWPEGVETRAFDGSEAMLRDFTDAYNDSFAQHFRFVRSTLEDSRAVTVTPGFRPDGVRLAYRGGACVGFCRNTLYAGRGEVAVLGTVRAARGIGLGRALLRWSMDWLERNGPDPVTLIVDGQNENALALYRAEGFGVARSRSIWGRRLAAGA